MIYSILAYFFFLGCFSSCFHYKNPTIEEIPQESSGESAFDRNRRACTDHWLYTIVPRHRSRIAWYDLPHRITWALMGNDDDGIFGENRLPPLFYPHAPPSLVKALRWQARNPLHNFCFYVIGSAERTNSEIDLIKVSRKEFCFCRYHPAGTTVFAGEESSFADGGSSFYLALHGGKPFVSLRFAYSCGYRFDFYCGWRCRGNFGIKCLPFAKRLRYDENDTQESCLDGGKRSHGK